MLKSLVTGLMVGIFLGLFSGLLGIFAFFVYGVANAPWSKNIAIFSLEIADIKITNTSFQMHLNSTGLLSLWAGLILISIISVVLFRNYFNRQAVLATNTFEKN